MGKPPRRVVILGGGMAALAAAFELTARDDWQKSISEVAIYQLGWRLGGKAASGRNQQVGSRTEGFGPHVWFGFYRNSFQILRACYQQLELDFEGVFRPHNEIVIHDETEDGPRPWLIPAEGNDSAPGENVADASAWQLIARGTELTHRLWTQFVQSPANLFPQDNSPQQAWAQQWMDHAVEFTKHLHDAVRNTDDGEEPLMTTSQDILDQTQRSLNEYVETLGDLRDGERRLYVLQDLLLSSMRGALAARVPIDGYHVLDQWEFRQWLAENNASATTLESPLLTAIYDYCFAYVDGDRQQPSLSAGVAVQTLARAALDYDGAFMWKAPAGMGEAAFAPLYRRLQQRGVKFHFFHQVQKVLLDADSSSIAEIHLDRQATSQQEYDPLITVDGRRAWPANPRYELLVEGDELQSRQIDLESPWSDWQPVERVELRVGQDFDDVILGMPLATLPYCCPDLIDAAPEWSAMFDNLQTVPTSVSRLWFNQDLKRLGWVGQPPILTGFPPPTDTWTDVTDAIPFEDWNPAPKCAAALRGVLKLDGHTPPPGFNAFPGAVLQQVQQSALQWVAESSALLWPDLHDPNSGVRWDYLVDPQDGVGEARLLAQYHRGNVAPSDRYVQSVPHGIQFRLSPAQSWFENLFICGDWTDTGLNIGCIEAATVSGIRAAQAFYSQWDGA